MMIYGLTANKIVLDEQQGLYILEIDNGIFADCRYDYYIGFENMGDLMHLFGQLNYDRPTPNELMSLYLTGYYDRTVEDFCKYDPDVYEKYQQRKAELWKEQLA
jgi:hypothetical protein